MVALSWGELYLHTVTMIDVIDFAAEKISATRAFLLCVLFKDF
jgi:hypothetical protein